MPALCVLYKSKYHCHPGQLFQCTGDSLKKRRSKQLTIILIKAFHKPSPIPCECGRVYIGETGRPMQERIKEHDRDIRLARTQISAISDLTWRKNLCIFEVTVLNIYCPMWVEDVLKKLS